MEMRVGVHDEFLRVDFLFPYALALPLLDRVALRA